MNIVVLAGGLSTERDVSFKTGSMVAKALKENGHKVILDVFMGYSDREEDLTGIFDRADEISVQVSDIPTEAPDLAKVKASRKDQSPCFFGPNVIKMCQMADIVFMALHGENGENGKLQAAFDLLGVYRQRLFKLSHRHEQGDIKAVLPCKRYPYSKGYFHDKSDQTGRYHKA